MRIFRVAGQYAAHMEGEINNARFAAELDAHNRALPASERTRTDIVPDFALTPTPAGDCIVIIASPNDPVARVFEALLRAWRRPASKRSA